MEQILIRVKNKEKAKMLLELLSALDFVDLVRTSSEGEAKMPEASQEAPTDFFSLAGLWEGRDVNLESIRQKAWPKQQHGSV